MLSPIRVVQVMGCMNCAGVEAVVMNHCRLSDRSGVRSDLVVCEGSNFVSGVALLQFLSILTGAMFGKNKTGR